MSPKSVTRELRNIVGHDFDLFYEAASGLKPANKCATHINQIVELLQPDQDPDFLDKLWQSNLGKLCFKDGFYDFAKGEFVPGFDDVMTTTKINRVFPERDQEAINEVYEQVLNPIFDDNAQMRDYFLFYTTRGLAGHIEDKAWAIGQGERNCGKGVLGACLHNAFQSYVNTTNSENFLMKAAGQVGGDCAKQLSWLVDFIFVRIMITNEITIDSKGVYVVNGNVLKKLSSGGDVIEGRKNFQDEMKFRVQCRPILFCNDMPPMEPKDALETCTVFKFPCKFVDDPTKSSCMLARIRQTDHSIKAKCATDRFIDAFTHIVLDAYKPTLIDPPQCIQEVEKDFKDDSSDSSNILSAFKMIPNNYLKCTHAHAYIKEKLNIAISPQKIANIFKTIGVVKKVYGQERLKHYYGIEFKDKAEADRWLIMKGLM